MANQSITDLTNYATVNSGNDVVPIVDTGSNATKKVTIDTMDTYLSQTNKTLTNKTLTSPKINEAVALSTTATKLNYLTSATGTTGTASTNLVFSTSPQLTSPNLNEAVALTSTSTKLNYLTNAGGTTGTNTTNVVFSTSPALTGVTLAAGTNTVEPLQFNSGTNLTAAAAGAIEYDGTNFYSTIDTTTGRAAVPAYQIYRLTGTGVSFTTIADAFAASNTGFPTVANAIYLIECLLFFSKTTSGTVVWTFTNTQTYTNFAAYMTTTPVGGVGTNGTATSEGLVANTAAAAALPATQALTTAVNHVSQITAVAEIGTAGNIRLRGTSSAGSAQLLRGSYMKMTRLYAGNVGTFVA